MMRLNNRFIMQEISPGTQLPISYAIHCTDNGQYSVTATGSNCNPASHSVGWWTSYINE